MILDLILIVIGAVACTALTVAVMVRKAPPLTTQVDRVTGKREHGLGKWWLFFAAFTIGPPFMLGIVLTLMAAVDWLNLNAPLWWIWAGLAGVCAVVAVGYRKVRRMQDRAYEPPVTIPPVEPPPQMQPPAMWSLPPGTPPLQQQR